MARLLIVALAALLAGCSQPEATPGSPPEEPRVAPPPTAGVESATPANATTDASESLRLEAEFYVEAMTPGVCREDLTTGCSFYEKSSKIPTFALAINDAMMANLTFSEWVFTATWVPTQPSAETVYMHVIDRNAENTIEKRKGTSPLEIRLARDMLSGTGDYRVRIAPVETGVLHNQSVTITLHTE